MTTTPEGRAKSLGEKLFEAVMANTPGEDRTTWVMVSPDVQSHFEGTALTFAASLTHDETANAVIASLTARAEASEQREAGLIAETVERFSDAIDAAHRINAWIDAIAAADADVVPSREIRRYTFNEDDGGAVLYFRDNQVAAGAFVVRDLWNFTVSMKVFAALTTKSGEA